MILAVTVPLSISQYLQHLITSSMVDTSVGGGAGSTDILISWICRLTAGISILVAAAVALIVSMLSSQSHDRVKKLHAFDVGR